MHARGRGFYFSLKVAASIVPSDASIGELSLMSRVRRNPCSEQQKTHDELYSSYAIKCLKAQLVFRGYLVPKGCILPQLCVLINHFNPDTLSGVDDAFDYLGPVHVCRLCCIPAVAHK